MFARSGTVTVRICVVWTLLDLLVGMVAHPRFRVFHRQSANPYAVVDVVADNDPSALSPHRRGGTTFIQLSFAGSTARLLAFPATGRHPKDFFTSRGWVPALFSCCGAFYQCLRQSASLSAICCI